MNTFTKVVYITYQLVYIVVCVLQTSNFILIEMAEMSVKLWGISVAMGLWSVVLSVAAFQGTDLV